MFDVVFSAEQTNGQILAIRIMILSLLLDGWKIILLVHGPFIWSVSLKPNNYYLVYSARFLLLNYG